MWDCEEYDVADCFINASLRDVQEAIGYWLLTTQRKKKKQKNWKKKKKKRKKTKKNKKKNKKNKKKKNNKTKKENEVGCAGTGWWVGSAAVILDCEAEESPLFCGGTCGEASADGHALQAPSSGGSEESCACAGSAGD